MDSERLKVCSKSFFFCKVSKHEESHVAYPCLGGTFYSFLCVCRITKILRKARLFVHARKVKMKLYRSSICVREPVNAISMQTRLIIAHSKKRRESEKNAALLVMKKMCFG